MTCTKCGREITPKEKLYQINLGRAEYGSKLDGCDIVFDLCDDCLTEFVNTFVHKDEILYSGANDFGYDLYGEVLLNGEGFINNMCDEMYKESLQAIGVEGGVVCTSITDK